MYTALIYCISAIVTITCPDCSSHDFHVSKTEAHYKTGQSALQVSVHLFIDDLELALKKYTDEPLHILSEKESPIADSLIHNYLSEKLIFNADGKTVHSEFIGKEISTDFQGVWCYLEYADLALRETIALKNIILCEIYEDQKNIVSLKIDNKTKAFHILDVEDQEIQLEID